MVVKCQLVAFRPASESFISPLPPTFLTLASIVCVIPNQEDCDIFNNCSPCGSDGRYYSPMKRVKRHFALRAEGSVWLVEKPAKCNSDSLTKSSVQSRNIFML
ncbi:hypothetical protein EVAR_60263_1 [Eumeta japonica]|uniref:Uncharacterized protein n=1 Tax=Eumeta variegata TaxID=151549 RepID=A0A4C1YYJ3_EUMVA|nr:hypothetical protein EVAR_60263_1 [Eumeta japonica]